MSTIVADPRTEQVQHNADQVCHLICEDCWKPGMPRICGDPDDGSEIHPEDCPNPTCPLCEIPTCPLCEMLWPEHDCG